MPRNHSPLPHVPGAAAHRPADAATQSPGGAGSSRRDFLRGAGGTTLAATLVGAAPLLSSCGGGGDNPNQLSFWNFYGPGGDVASQSKWFVDLVKSWNAQNKVKIKLRYIPSPEYVSGSTLKVAFESGSGPDIFLLSPGDFLRYYNGDVLQDLTPYLPDGLKSDYVTGALDTRMVDGKVYGLPMEIEPLAMYYSVDAFEKAGLSEGDIPTSWDGLLSVADQLTTKDRYGVLFETTPGYYQNFTWYPFLWQGGGRTLSKNQQSAAFDSKPAAAALDLWKQAVQRGVAPRTVQGTGGNDPVSNLAAGYCAMHQTGVWGLAALNQNAADFEYGVFELPAPQGGDHTTCLGGWAFAVNSRGANPEAAAKFVAWALGGSSKQDLQRQLKWNTEVKTNVTPRKSVRRLAEQEGAYSGEFMQKFVQEIAPKGKGEPRYPSEMYKAISDAIQKCQLSGGDPKAEAARAAQRIDAFLKSYDGAPIT